VFWKIRDITNARAQTLDRISSHGGRLAGRSESSTGTPRGGSLILEHVPRTRRDVDVDTGVTRVRNTGAAALPFPTGSFAPLRVALVECFLQFLNFACCGPVCVPSARQGFHHTLIKSRNRAETRAGEG